MDETAYTARRSGERSSASGWLRIRHRIESVASFKYWKRQSFETLANWLPRTEASHSVWRWTYFQKFQHRTSPENPFRASFDGITARNTESSDTVFPSVGARTSKRSGCHLVTGRVKSSMAPSCSHRSHIRCTHYNVTIRGKSLGQTMPTE